MSTMFRFGCGHVTVDPDVHEASWGARLIYREVAEGGGGIVWNRQTPDGDAELLTALVFPAVDRAMPAIRSVLAGWLYGWSGESERGHIVIRDGRVVTVASPQQSYGYLYVTSVLERRDKVGQTKVWTAEEMNAQAASDAIGYGHRVPHATIISNDPESLKRMRQPLKDAASDEAYPYPRGPRALREMKAAQKALEDFDALWPDGGIYTPAEPAAVIPFPAPKDWKRGSGGTPKWLEAIWASRDTCVAAGLHPAYQSNAPDDPDPDISLGKALTWDDRVMFAEGHSVGGRLIVRNFLSGDGAALWEVYAPEYVEPLRSAAASV